MKSPNHTFETDMRMNKSFKSIFPSRITMAFKLQSGHIIRSKNLFRMISVLPLVFASFYFNSLTAQTTERLYNHKWEQCDAASASFYSLTVKTDSGYYRRDFYIRDAQLQMSGLYLDSICEEKNGYFTFYYPDGGVKSSGKYANNELDGPWVSYHYNKVRSDSAIYSKGKRTGTSLYWHTNGTLSDSLYRKDKQTYALVSWFSNAQLSAKGDFAANFDKIGRWDYYHKNGQPSGIEYFENGKRISAQYFDDQGNISQDTSGIIRIASFKGGEKKYRKYLQNKLHFPKGYKISNASSVSIVVTFTVTEEGKIENVYTSVPFDHRFDTVVEKVVKQFPDWIPAKNNNRNISMQLSLPVKFSNHK